MAYAWLHFLLYSVCGNPSDILTLDSVKPALSAFDNSPDFSIELSSFLASMRFK